MERVLEGRQVDARGDPGTRAGDDPDHFVALAEGEMGSGVGVRGLEAEPLEAEQPPSWAPDGVIQPSVATSTRRAVMRLIGRSS